MLRRAALVLLPGACALAACGGDPEISSAFAPDAGPAAGSFTLDAAPAGAPARVVVGLDAAGAGLGCAAETIHAERLPIDLFFMVDVSGSMIETTASGTTKWDALRAAMNAFLGDPRSAGLGAGVQYFPQVVPGVPDRCTADGACGAHGPCGRARTCWPARQVEPCARDADCGAGRSCVLLGQCTGSSSALCAAIPGAVCPGGGGCQELPGYCLGRDTCDVAAYATPAVPVGILPEAARAIAASLAQKKPEGLTPTGPALSGAHEHARRLARERGDRRVAVVLATDGLPSGCAPADIPGIAGIAERAARGTPRIPTFVLGVFSPEERAVASANLDAIARAGGTGRAHVVTTAQNLTHALIAALNSVRSAALACEYRIPQPTQGQIDHGKVNVQFVSGRGEVSVIGKVKDRASCHPTLGGWYYDVAPAPGIAPTRIYACDETCAGLQGDPGGRVDIVFGCETVVIE